MNMVNIPEELVACDPPRIAKPRSNTDRKALRAEINENFSETLAYLAR